VKLRDLVRTGQELMRRDRATADYDVWLHTCCDYQGLNKLDVGVVVGHIDLESQESVKFRDHDIVSGACTECRMLIGHKMDCGQGR
jgi:hypothetical protein